MNEGQAISKWLYELFAAAAPVTALVSTRLYEGLAPQRNPLEANAAPAFPYVVWSLNSAQVTPAAGADRRVLTRARVVISAYAEGGSYLDADAVAAAFDAALEGAKSEVTVGSQSYWVGSAQMETPLRMMEASEGRRIYRSGGVYLILAHGLP